MIAATPKLIRPWLAMNGRSNPQSWFSAHPAMKPPAVTNVPWARLTIPPRPVTTTNERNTIASAMPGARIPRTSKSSARAQPHGSHCNVKATKTRIQIAHGSSRRHWGSPARWSKGGFSSATERASPPRLRPTKKSSTTVRMNGMAERRPESSLTNLGRMSSP